MFIVLKRGWYSFIPPPRVLNNPPRNGSELSMALPFLDKVQPLFQTGSSSTRFHRGRTRRALWPSSFSLCQPVQGRELILIDPSLVDLSALVCLTLPENTSDTWGNSLYDGELVSSSSSPNHDMT